MVTRFGNWLTRWLDGIGSIVVAGLAAELDVAPSGHRSGAGR